MFLFSLSLRDVRVVLPFSHPPPSFSLRERRRRGGGREKRGGEKVFYKGGTAQSVLLFLLTKATREARRDFQRWRFRHLLSRRRHPVRIRKVGDFFSSQTASGDGGDAGEPTRREATSFSLPPSATMRRRQRAGIGRRGKLCWGRGWKTFHSFAAALSYVRENHWLERNLLIEEERRRRPCYQKEEGGGG